MIRYASLVAGVALASTVTLAVAGDDPIEVRHELMEGVGDSAKAIGGMLKGEAPFDAQAAMDGFLTMRKASEEFGSLFPEGSETGGDTEAKSTIWTDREGFDAILASFGESVEAAIADNPSSLEELKASAGPVFENCKACHEDYRVEKD
jgi:cytochrome c556